MDAGTEGGVRGGAVREPLHPLPSLHVIGGGHAGDDDFSRRVLCRQLGCDRPARLPEDVARAAQAQASGRADVGNEWNICDPRVLNGERAHLGDRLRKTRALIRPFDGDRRGVRPLPQAELQELRVLGPAYPQRAVATQRPLDGLLDRRELSVAGLHILASTVIQVLVGDLQSIFKLRHCFGELACRLSTLVPPRADHDDRTQDDEHQARQLSGQEEHGCAHNQGGHEADEWETRGLGAGWCIGELDRSGDRVWDDLRRPDECDVRGLASRFGHLCLDQLDLSVSKEDHVTGCHRGLLHALVANEDTVG